jgi:hypothetical protein
MKTIKEHLATVASGQQTAAELASIFDAEMVASFRAYECYSETPDEIKAYWAILGLFPPKAKPVYRTATPAQMAAYAAAPRVVRIGESENHEEA